MSVGLYLDRYNLTDQINSGSVPVDEVTITHNITNQNLEVLTIGDSHISDVAASKITGTIDASNIATDDVKISHLEVLGIDTLTIPDTYINQALTETSDVIFNNLTVNGTQTILNSETLTIEDNIIVLANNNVADLTDIGFVGKYVSGGVDYYAGMVRDRSDGGIFKLIESTTTLPIGEADVADLGKLELEDLTSSGGGIYINNTANSVIGSLTGESGAKFQILGDNTNIVLNADGPARTIDFQIDSSTYALLNTSGLAVYGDITVSGMVDNVDIQTLNTSVGTNTTNIATNITDIADVVSQSNANFSDIGLIYADIALYDDELKSLTDVEIQQLQNIGTTTISATQWGYLGALNQPLTTGDSVDFNGVSCNGFGPPIDGTDNIMLFTQPGNSKSSWLRHRRGGDGTGYSGTMYSSYDTSNYFVHNLGGTLRFEYASDSTDYYSATRTIPFSISSGGNVNYTGTLNGLDYSSVIQGDIDWLGSHDSQGLGSTDSPTFDNLTLTGNIRMTSTASGDNIIMDVLNSSSTSKYYLLERQNSPTFTQTGYGMVSDSGGSYRGSITYAGDEYISFGSTTNSTAYLQVSSSGDTEITGLTTCRSTLQVRPDDAENSIVLATGSGNYGYCRFYDGSNNISIQLSGSTSLPNYISTRIRIGDNSAADSSNDLEVAGDTLLGGSLVSGPGTFTTTSSSDGAQGMTITNSSTGAAGIRFNVASVSTQPWQLFVASADQFKVGRAAKWDALVIDDSTGDTTLRGLTCDNINGLNIDSLVQGDITRLAALDQDLGTGDNVEFNYISSALNQMLFQSLRLFIVDMSGISYTMARYPSENWSSNPLYWQSTGSKEIVVEYICATQDDVMPPSGATYTMRIYVSNSMDTTVNNTYTRTIDVPSPGNINREAITTFTLPVGSAYKIDCQSNLTSGEEVAISLEGYYLFA